jgi:uncharacterized membrane protein YbhN (UPF0104 family)
MQLSDKSGQSQGFRMAPALRKAAAIAVKILITGFCFWYVARQINVAEFVRRVHTIDVAAASLAIVAILAQIPLVTLRWCAIIDALSQNGERVARVRAFAITALSIFFGQFLFYAAGDAVRVAMLRRTGRALSQSAVSVVLDRGIGVVVLAAFGFVILLVPSPLASLGGNRDVVRGVFGVLLFAFVIGLIAIPRIVPFLSRWTLSAWLGKLALATHNVLLRSRAGLSIVLFAAGVHVLTILSIRCIGLALGLSFSLLDSAVLFTLIGAAALIPVSLGGWGMREAAVVAVLTSQGFAAEQALFFSVCYGLTLVFGSLLGALLVWAVCAPLSADANVNKVMLRDAILRDERLRGAMGQHTPVTLLVHDGSTSTPS